jgi:aspartate/methionine/tyrosine aminotransferase
MRLEPFAMERMQSTYENLVDFNLSESGVHPLTLGELVPDAASREALLAEGLRYTQSNGTMALRSAIASLYPGATPDHVQVTNGGSEANYITTWNLVEPGDEVILMVPNYMQTWGLARAFGGTVKKWPLIQRSTGEGGAGRAEAGGEGGTGRGEGGTGRAEAATAETGRGEGGWRVDLDALDALVTPRTKLIIICNPNNPTGARIDAEDLDRIAAAAARHHSWVLSDEIYRGAELDGRETPTMWDRYDRAVVTSGLSKAYGLPGLRIGWIVAPPPLVATLWSYHDYTTIAPGALSDALARRALEPARRREILARTRRILNENFPVIAEWLDTHGALFTYARPDAGAIVYVQYQHRINSTDLVTRLRHEKSVLIVPGDHFGMDRYLRIGFGDKPDYLRQGLARLRDLLTDLAA